MIKSAKLLAALTALCLLFSLTGGALAQTAETPPKTAETGGWPEEMIGSWVGLHENLWVQYSFYWSGKYRLTVFEDPSLDSTDTWETFGQDYSVAVDGDLMQLTLRGTTGTFRRVPEPDSYVRVKTEDESISPSVDPLLLGTWGGRIGEDYVEWTFRGDGQFTRSILIPYKVVRAEGRYLAGGGSLAILEYGKLLTCTYNAGAKSITVDLPDDGRVILNSKSGQLAKMNIDENEIAWTYTRKGPEGWVAQRYFGSEPEVGIPGVFAYSAVVGIDDGAFKGNRTIQSVTIPEFVAEIGRGAFEGCESLRDVLFIGTDSGNADLTSYREVGVTVIPGSCPLKTIGMGAFRGCSSLENLNLAQSTHQSPNSFYWIGIGRSDVRGINLPDGLETIGANAFEGCESITSVTIPDSVTEIGKDAFKGCDQVTLIVAEASYAYSYAKSYGIPFILRGE